jgi:hypothetical protein
MSTERETARVVRSWLRTEEHESADRVLDAVLDRLDTTPQRRSTLAWAAWRVLPMSYPLRWGAAAVAAVAILIGAWFVYGNGGFGTEAPTSSPAASRAVISSPTPVSSGSLPESGSVIPGSYTIADPFPVRLGIEIPSGWTMWSPGVEARTVALYKDSPDPPSGQALGFLIVDNVLADPCDSAAGLMEPPVGPEPIDLAEALAAQTGTEATEPAPVEIGGFSGVYLDYRNTGDGECASMQRWPGRDALNGERDQVWILDVDGTRVVIDAASFDGTSEEDLAEMRAIVESMSIDP